MAKGKFGISLVGIVFMIVAIAIAQFASGYMAVFLGSLASGIVGSLITGAIAYVIYTLITKGKFGLTPLAIFAVLVFIANMLAGLIAEYIGIGGGYLGLIITGCLASILWGWIGGRQGAKTPKAPKI